MVAHSATTLAVTLTEQNNVRNYVCLTPVS